MSAEATIRDVAKRAKVSVATVSRVLNNSPAVRDQTRRRVLTAMDDLDYSPNPIAQKLSGGRSRTIAVVLPLFTLPSFVERLRGVHRELADNQYDLILYSIETPGQRDAYMERLTGPSRLDGLVLISVPPTDEQVARLKRARISTVLVDAIHPQVPHVIVDDEDGGCLATRYLISLGHRRIAYLSDFLDTPFHQSMRKRYHGYRRALEESGIEFKQKYHVWDTHGRPEARSLARQLLEMEDPPTAIFAASDTQAIGVLDAAREMNVAVPEELSVIGFDGIRDSEYLELSTIEQPLYESGVCGASTLLDLLHKNSNGHELRIVLPLHLAERATTAPPRATRVLR